MADGVEQLREALGSGQQLRRDSLRLSDRAAVARLAQPLGERFGGAATMTGARVVGHQLDDGRGEAGSSHEPMAAGSAETASVSARRPGGSSP